MMSTRLIPVFVVLACVIGGCDGNPNDPSDSDGEPTIAQIVGTWNATSIVFTSQSQQSVDVILTGGTATLTISGDGRYTYVTNFPGQPIRNTMGSLRFENGFLIVVDDEVPNSPLRFLASKSDDRLSLQENESEFDFDNDGILEPAFASYDFDKV